MNKYNKLKLISKGSFNTVYKIKKKIIKYICSKKTENRYYFT